MRRCRRSCGLKSGIPAALQARNTGGVPTPARHEPLRDGSLSSRRAKKTETATPKDKARIALEAKAEKGDVYAIRELREHNEYWYGQADTAPLHALATPLQLQALHDIAVDKRAGVESAWLEGIDVPDPPLH